jgi:predicted nucleic acid-binding protein
MPPTFVDTFYFFALGNRHDPAHAKALAFSQTYTGRLVTTDFICIEFADGCARTTRHRLTATRTIERLRTNPKVEIVACTRELLQTGLQLYEKRPDKSWSLTDCISFSVMEKEGITEALTGDHHFEQAGFVALLR